MPDLEAVQEAISMLQGFISEADGRDMVAKRPRPPEAVLEEGADVEDGPELVAVVDDEPEEKAPLTPEERRKLVGY